MRSDVNKEGLKISRAFFSVIALAAVILATLISTVLLVGLGFYGGLGTAKAETGKAEDNQPGEPDTAISSWVDHDSASDPRDEDGNGTETTIVTYSVTNADGAQYAIDGGSWRASPPSPFEAIVLPADGQSHILQVRATRSSDGAVDPTPAQATLTICPQAGCPGTTISSWMDHDSATPIDEDGNGTETTVVTYSVSNADGAQYNLDNGAWTTAPASPFNIVLNANGVPHTLYLRAKRSSDDAVDPTPATATITMCPQAGCDPTPSSNLYFVDDYERDTAAMVPPWDSSGTCYGPTGGVTTDTTHVRKGTYAGKYEVYDNDCPSHPTRALTRWDEHFCPGDERYISYSMYVPSNLPAPSPSWMNLGQFGYGPPWGYPPLHFDNDNDGYHLSVYNQYNSRLVYIPFRRDAWTDIVLHEKFSQDSTVGFVELWVNGSPLTMANGSTRYYTNTLRDDSNGACGSLDIQQYRKAGMWPSPLTIWFDEVKVWG